MAAFDRLPASEFDTLQAAGNTWPISICVVSTIMYVLDARRNKIFAYTVSTKQRDVANDFDTLDIGGVVDPKGIWSDGETMYVSDGVQNKLVAFNNASKARDSAKDIDLVEVDGFAPSARGIFGNSRTVWCVYEAIARVVAYDRVTLARAEQQDFSSAEIPTLLDNLFDIWATDTVIWVGDSSDATLYAFDLRSKRRLASLDFTLRGRERSLDIEGRFVRNVIPAALTPTGLAFGGGAVPPSTPGDTSALPSNALLILNSHDVLGEVFSISRGGVASVGGISSAAMAGLEVVDIATEDSRNILALDGNTHSVIRFLDGVRQAGTVLSRASVDAQFFTRPDVQAIAVYGNTIWIADQVTRKIAAFTGGVYDDALSVAPSVMNGINPQLTFAGMDHDGETLLVLDSQAKAVWGVFPGTAGPDAEKNVSRESIESANPAIVPAGLAFDGIVLWIIDEQSNSIYAFKGSSRSRHRKPELDIPANLVGTTGSIHAVVTRGKDVYVSIGTSVKALTYGTPVAIEAAPDFTLAQDDLEGVSEGFTPAGLIYDGVDYVAVDRNFGLWGFKYNATTKEHDQVTAKNISIETIGTWIIRGLRAGRDFQARDFLPVDASWDSSTSEYLVLDASPSGTTALKTQRILAVKSDNSGGWTHRIISVNTNVQASFIPGKDTAQAISQAEIAAFKRDNPQFASASDSAVIAEMRKSRHAPITDLTRVLFAERQGWAYDPLIPNPTDGQRDARNPSRGSTYGRLLISRDAIDDWIRQVEAALGRSAYGYWTRSSFGAGVGMRQSTGLASDGVHSYILGRHNDNQWIVAALEMSSGGYVASRSTTLTGLPADADLRGLGWDNRGHFYVGDHQNQVAYAYDWRWQRSQENDISRADLYDSSAVMWIRSIGTDGDGRIFVGDAYNRNFWAFTRTPATPTSHDATKDVSATIIGNGSNNITGLADDATNLYCGFGTGANCQVVAIAGGIKVAGKSIANSVLAAQGITKIDGMTFTDGELVILSGSEAYRFEDGVFQEKSSLTSVGVTSTSRGVAYIQDVPYFADNAGAITALQGIGKDEARSFPAAFVNRTVAKLGGITSIGNDLLVGQDEGLGLYGFTPYARTPQAQAEVETPEGFFAEIRNDADDNGLMWVLSGGVERRIYAFEMPVVPTEPYWLNPVGEPQDWAVGTAITPIDIPAPIAIPDATFSAAGLPSSGVSFDAENLRLVPDGTPSTGGSGTVRIAATNEYGTRYYTIRYRILATVAPGWDDTTGDPIQWYVGTPVRYTVPAVDRGYPDPTYSIGGLPPEEAGVFSFDAETHTIIGDPTAERDIGSGVTEGDRQISVTATVPGQPAATWTVTYSISRSVVVPVRPYYAGGTNNTGHSTELPPVVWTQGAPIPTLIIPQVDRGSPAPSYSPFDLPRGGTFDATLRALGGVADVGRGGRITIAVVNIAGRFDYYLDYTIQPNTNPRPPSLLDVITPGEPEYWNSGSYIRYEFPVFDFGHPTPVLAITGEPPSMTKNLDPTGPSFEGQLPSGYLGAGTAELSVTASGSTVTYQIPWSVVQAPPRFPDPVGPARVFIVGKRFAPFFAPRAG